jgi:hypothetical protein
MAARTNTEQFEYVNGHKPRGWGLWYFDLHFTDGNGRFSSETVAATGTLAEARQVAWKQVKATVGGARQLVEVDVLP